VYVVDYILVFFFIFFETLKYQFHKNPKKELQGAWAPKRFSAHYLPFLISVASGVIFVSIAHAEKWW
jgi:hypothetical protein